MSRHHTPDTFEIHTPYRMWAEGNGNPFRLLPGAPVPVTDEALPIGTWQLHKNGHPIGEPVKVSKNPGEGIRAALLAAGAHPVDKSKQVPSPEPEPVPEPDPAPEVQTPSPTTSEPVEAPVVIQNAIFCEPSQGGQITWSL